MKKNFSDIYKDKAKYNVIRDLTLTPSLGFDLKDFLDIEHNKNYLSALEKINASENMLSKAVLRGVTTLKVLIIKRNMLTEVVLKLPKLIELDLSFNLIHHMIDLTDLPCLKSLNLSSNLITNINVTDFVSVKSTLKDLSLGFNRINFEVHAFIAFIEGLKAFNLISLSLEGNDFIDLNPALTNNYKLYTVSSIKSLSVFNDEKILVNLDSIDPNQLTLQILELDKSNIGKEIIATTSNNKNVIESPEFKNRPSRKTYDIHLKDNLYNVNSINKMPVRQKSKNNNLIDIKYNERNMAKLDTEINNKLINNVKSLKDNYLLNESKSNKSKSPRKSKLEDTKKKPIITNELNNLKGFKDVNIIIEALNLCGGFEQSLIIKLFDYLNLVLITEDFNDRDKDQLLEEHNNFNYFLMNCLNLIELNSKLEKTVYQCIGEFSLFSNGIFSKKCFSFFESLVMSSLNRCELIVNILKECVIKRLERLKENLPFSVLETIINFLSNTGIKFEDLYIALILNILHYFLNISYNKCFPFIETINNKTNYYTKNIIINSNSKNAKDPKEDNYNELIVCLGFIKHYLEIDYTEEILERNKAQFNNRDNELINKGFMHYEETNAKINTNNFKLNQEEENVTDENKNRVKIKNYINIDYLIDESFEVENSENNNNNLIDKRKAKPSTVIDTDIPKNFKKYDNNYSDIKNDKYLLKKYETEFGINIFDIDDINSSDENCDNPNSLDILDIDSIVDDDQIIEQNIFNIKNNATIIGDNSSIINTSANLDNKKENNKRLLDIDNNKINVDNKKPNSNSKKFSTINSFYEYIIKSNKLEYNNLDLEYNKSSKKITNNYSHFNSNIETQLENGLNCMYPNDLLYNISHVSKDILDKEIFSLNDNSLEESRIKFRLIFELTIFKLNPLLYKLSFFFKTDKYSKVLEEVLKLIETLSKTFKYNVESLFLSELIDNLKSKFSENFLNKNNILYEYENFIHPIISKYYLDISSFDDIIHTYIKNTIDKSYKNTQDREELEDDEFNNLEVVNRKEYLKSLFSKCISAYGAINSLLTSSKVKSQIQKDINDKILVVLALSNNDAYMLQGCCNYLLNLLENESIQNELSLLNKLFTKAGDFKHLLPFLDPNELKFKNMMDKLLYSNINNQNYQKKKIIQNVGLEFINNTTIKGTIVAITKIFRKLSYFTINPLYKGDIGKYCLAKCDALIDLNIHEIIGNLIKIKDDNVRKIVVEYFYYQEEKLLKLKVFSQINDIMSSFRSVTVGETEVILSIVYLIYNRVALDYNRIYDLKTAEVLIKAVNLGINFIIQNNDRNPNNKEEIIQKNQLSACLLLFINTCYRIPDFINYFNKEKKEQFRAILFYDHINVKPDYYLPLEIERTQFGNFSSYLFEVTMSNNPVQPYSWTFARIMIKLADLMCNIEDFTYNVDYRNDISQILNDLNVEFNLRVKIKILNEKFNWFVIKSDLKYDVSNKILPEVLNKIMKEYNKKFEMSFISNITLDNIINSKMSNEYVEKILGNNYNNYKNNFFNNNNNINYDMHYEKENYNKNNNNIIDSNEDNNKYKYNNFSFRIFSSVSFNKLHTSELIQEQMNFIAYLPTLIMFLLCKTSNLNDSNVFDEIVKKFNIQILESERAINKIYLDLESNNINYMKDNKDNLKSLEYTHNLNENLNKNLFFTNFKSLKTTNITNNLLIKLITINNEELVNLTKNSNIINNFSLDYLTKFNAKSSLSNNLNNDVIDNVTRNNTNIFKKYGLKYCYNRNINEENFNNTHLRSTIVSALLRGIYSCLISPSYIVRFLAVENLSNELKFKNLILLSLTCDIFEYSIFHKLLSVYNNLFIIDNVQIINKSFLKNKFNKKVINKKDQDKNNNQLNHNNDIAFENNEEEDLIEYNNKNIFANVSSYDEYKIFHCYFIVSLSLNYLIIEYSRKYSKLNIEEYLSTRILVKSVINYVNCIYSIKFKKIDQNTINNNLLNKIITKEFLELCFKYLRSTNKKLYTAISRFETINSEVYNPTITLLNKYILAYFNEYTEKLTNFINYSILESEGIFRFFSTISIYNSTYREYINNRFFYNLIKKESLINSLEDNIIVYKEVANKHLNEIHSINNLNKNNIKHNDTFNMNDNSYNATNINMKIKSKQINDRKCNISINNNTFNASKFNSSKIETKLKLEPNIYENSFLAFNETKDLTLNKNINSSFIGKQEINSNIITPFKKQKFINPDTFINKTNSINNNISIRNSNINYLDVPYNIGNINQNNIKALIKNKISYYNNFINKEIDNFRDDNIYQINKTYEMLLQSNIKVKNITYIKDNLLNFNEHIVFFDICEYFNFADHIVKKCICVLTNKYLFIFEYSNDSELYNKNKIFIRKISDPLIKIKIKEINTIFIFDYRSRLLFDVQKLKKPEGNYVIKVKNNDNTNYENLSLTKQNISFSLLFLSINSSFNLLESIKKGILLLNASCSKDLKKSKTGYNNNYVKHIRQINVTSFLIMIQKFELSNNYVINESKRLHLYQLKQINKEKAYLEDYQNKSEIDQINNFLNLKLEELDCEFPLKDNIYSNIYLQKKLAFNKQVFMIYISNESSTSYFNKFTNFNINNNLNTNSNHTKLKESRISAFDLKKKIIYISDFFLYQYSEDMKKMLSLPSEEYILGDQTNNKKYAELMYSLDLKIRVETILYYEEVNEEKLKLCYIHKNDDNIAKFDRESYMKNINVNGNNESNSELSFVEYLFPYIFDFYLFKSRIDAVLKIKDYEKKMMNILIGKN